MGVTLAGPDLEKHARPKEETWTRKSKAGFRVGGRKPRPAPPAELLSPAADSVPGEPRRSDRPSTLLAGLLLYLKAVIECRFLMLLELGLPSEGRSLLQLKVQ